MLKKWLFLLGVFFSFVAQAEEKNVNDTILSRRLNPVSSNLYVEVFGSLMPDRVILGVLRGEECEERTYNPKGSNVTVSLKSNKKSHNNYSLNPFKSKKPKKKPQKKGLDHSTNIDTGQSQKENMATGIRWLRLFSVPEQANSLNELIKEHRWLIGFTLGYRFNKKQSVEFEFPSIGSFSPFYAMPSLGYRKMLTQNAKITTYYKAGVGAPIACLKRTGVRGWLEGSMQDQQSSTVLPWEFDINIFLKAGATCLIYPGIFLETSLSAAYPFSHTVAQSSQLPFNLIVSAQLGVRIKLR